MIKYEFYKYVLTLSCLPSSGVLQQRLSSQDAAGRHSRGVLKERLSSQDAAGRHSRGECTTHRTEVYPD
ncbi:hypothetical protein CesoFtcFv8_000693 [Champsocephalus esox]|uniref:Uncharacterized protein n=1 Tax=Champsocephalus esox TaxID=159716 RepID=A0AAN8D4B6_9TELE|nr:hypothetical protein CesoFtcFv8_000693 [Champsocephalus esox]